MCLCCLPFCQTTIQMMHYSSHREDSAAILSLLASFVALPFLGRPCILTPVVFWEWSLNIVLVSQYCLPACLKMRLASLGTHHV